VELGKTPNTGLIAMVAEAVLVPEVAVSVAVPAAEPEAGGV
jgi:hypothetical protein